MEVLMDPDIHALLPGEWRSEGNSQGWVRLARQGSSRHSTDYFVSI